jgi:hypothetical protein
MIMCHMMADSLDELHAMAEKIGMQRKWFQQGKYPHYDICKQTRKLAVSNGALEVSSKDLIRKFRYKSW